MADQVPANREPERVIQKISLTMDEQTVKRLKVHAAMTFQRPGAAAEEILLEWLIDNGEGRQYFEGSGAMQDGEIAA